jgi:hypothetical protein
LLFDVVIIRFSTFWSTKKTISTFWQLKRPFRRSEIFGLSTFWSSTFRPPLKLRSLHCRRLIFENSAKYKEHSLCTYVSGSNYDRKQHFKQILKKMNLMFWLNTNLCRIVNSFWTVLCQLVGCIHFHDTNSSFTLIVIIIMWPADYSTALMGTSGLSEFKTTVLNVRIKE